MGKVVMTGDGPPMLTEEQRAQLAAVQDIAPDTVDIPPAPAASWEHARRFYRVRKEPISIRGSIIND